MENKKKVWIMIMTLVVLIGGAAILYKVLGDKMPQNEISKVETDAEENNKEDEEVGEEADASEEEATTEEYKAPDFTVMNQDGEMVKLSDYIGKPIVLNFWASWCGPCKSEMQTFENAYKKYKDDVQFMMVNATDGSRETVETAKEYIEKEGFTFPVFYDTEQEASYTYQVYSIPNSFFIDAEGNLQGYMSGAMDAETLQKGIDLIYKN